jgi:succinoglycan biosynthesis protein ExoA
VTPAGESPAPGVWPPVSVVMPLRDEAAGLESAVRAVLAQDYPGDVEVVLAVAPSTDATAEAAARLAEHDPRVRVVANPAGSTPAGLNAAIAASAGEIVVRVDGHAELSPGYVHLAVQLLADTGADNVGGLQRAVGSTAFERAVAAAMSSRFGVGDAKFHYGGDPGPTDTVYLGVFRRDALVRVGGFDESLVRNQDYELNVRLRDTGGTVWFDPRLEVAYRPRGTVRSLARQYYEYGWWKRHVLRRHPGSVRWRQLVPPVAVAANVTSLLLAAGGQRRALAVPTVYAAAALAASAVAGRGRGGAVSARLPLVFATMHHAWGAGFLVAQITGGRPMRVIRQMVRQRSVRRGPGDRRMPSR